MASITYNGSISEKFNEMKSKFPDAIMLFREGDFYITIHKDALIASEILAIPMNSRSCAGQHIFVTGFPHYSLDIYLPQLVRAGKRIAIIEELVDPNPKEYISPNL